MIDSPSASQLTRFRLPDQPKSIPVRRKLHLGHFAFMRALVQGLDTSRSWDRYLRIEGERTDIRTVRRTVAWLRDEFAAAAKRHDRHGTARLVQIDVSTIVEQTTAIPSLEDFAIERGLEDFSEAEQLEAYQQEYGNATQCQSRRARLLAKQLEALRWLENLVAEPPRAGDAVAAWLHPDLAARLEDTGIVTLQQLVDHINGIGRGWSRSIRAIGAGKADRILDWLRAHEQTIGASIGGHVGIPRSKLDAGSLQVIVPRATAIVPIEKFLLPFELSGAMGQFRAPQAQCLMAATNDYEAILEFVKSKHGLPPEQVAAMKRKRGIATDAPAAPLDWLKYLSDTQRAYLKETERFLLWAIVQHRKPLSSMTLDDCIAYRNFLADPQPSEKWCGPRGRERWSPLWRPFEGPLSASARRRAITILKTFYKFLTDQRYLIGNPWTGVAKPKAEHDDLDIGRSFTQAQWEFIAGKLDQMPATSANLRLRIGLRLLYATGLRRSELVSARVRDLSWASYPPMDEDDELVEGWELKVTGKGGKRRVVPVPPVVAEDLAAYLASRGLASDLSAPENKEAYLLGWAVDVAERAPWSPVGKQTIDPHAGISAGTFYDQLKAFFAECAVELASEDPEASAHLKKASTHWLRHTRISHSLAAGTDPDVERQIAGHASLATTSKYSHVEARRRLLGMAKFWKSKGMRKPLPE